MAQDFGHNGSVSAILYPIAADAQEALTAPRGRAARESDARGLAAEPVRFVREFTGPVFKTEEDGLDANVGRLDDIRSGARTSVTPQDRYCELKAVSQRSRIPFAGPHTVWRLSVGYWKVGQDAVQTADLPQARKARRDRNGEAPDGQVLDALAQQPLRPIRAQKALDIGLFEVPMPEAPGRLMPDE
jgi:hypothetical protein